MKMAQPFPGRLAAGHHRDGLRLDDRARRRSGALRRRVSRLPPGRSHDRRSDRRNDRRAVLLSVAAAGVAASPRSARRLKSLGEVRVHGNHTTPDADVLAHCRSRRRRAGHRRDRCATADGAAAPAAAASTTSTCASAFRSIDDPTDILVIILVDEVTGISEDDLTPGPMKKMRSLGMWLPVLDYADGYGFTYGARSRSSTRSASAAASRCRSPGAASARRRSRSTARFERGPFTRVEGAVSISRRENPHFEIRRHAQRSAARAERALTPWLRVGGGARVDQRQFRRHRRHASSRRGARRHRSTRAPIPPSRATRSTSWLGWSSFASTAVDQHRALDDRSARLRRAVRLERAGASRGDDAAGDRRCRPTSRRCSAARRRCAAIDFGYRAGDNLAAVSAELRVPFTSPVYMGRLGVKAFVDAGTVYPYGAKLSDQTFDRGVGGGVFITWAVIRMGLDVAWPITGGLAQAALALRARSDVLTRCLQDFGQTGTGKTRWYAHIDGPAAA